VQLAEYTHVTSPEFRGDPQRPESWLAERGEVLRELPGRQVYRARIGDQCVVIKEFAPHRLRRRLRSCAQAEAETALDVRRRGVPIVEPLACARLRDGRQVLVLREEAGARSLKDLVLEGSVRGRARHALAQAVGDLFARMQNAGIRHRDPHAGNVLVRPDGTVLLGDAWDLRPGDYLTAGQRADGLATFGLFFLTHASTVDILLFWGAYGRAACLPPDDLEDLRQRVLDRIPDAFRRLAGTRLRKVRRLGQPVVVGGFGGLLTGDIAPALLEEVVRRATRLEDGPDVIKRSPTAWTFRAGDDYVAKVFLPKKATRPLRDFFRGTRAERALEAAQALAHRGLETPEVVAVLKEREGGSRSILVMRRVTDARPLDEALADKAPGEARRLAAGVGRRLRRMHDWGLRHRDLKKDNVLVDEHGELRLLDLDGVRQTKGPLDWHRRARDLANLDGSLLDRNRVPTGVRLFALDAYLGGEVPPGFPPGEFARLVARYARESRERRLER